MTFRPPRRGPLIQQYEARVIPPRRPRNKRHNAGPLIGCMRLGCLLFIVLGAGFAVLVLIGLFTSGNN